MPILDITLEVNLFNSMIISGIWNLYDS